MYKVITIIKRKIPNNKYNNMYYSDEYLDTEYYDICNYDEKYLYRMKDLAYKYQKEYDNYSKENPDLKYKCKFFVKTENMPGSICGGGYSSGQHIPLKNSVLGDIIKDEHRLGSYTWYKYYGDLWDR